MLQEDPIAAEILKPTGRYKVTPKPINGVWFFQFEDGEPFAVEEKEAWELLKTRGMSFRRRGVKLIGASDGRIYAAGLMAASKLNGSAARKIVLQAFADEVEKARENMRNRLVKLPSNQDIITPGATQEQRAKILREMEV
jgi:hypothetical protein